MRAAGETENIERFIEPRFVLEEVGVRSQAETQTRRRLMISGHRVGDAAKVCSFWRVDRQIGEVAPDCRNLPCKTFTSFHALDAGQQTIDEARNHIRAKRETRQMFPIVLALDPRALQEGSVRQNIRRRPELVEELLRRKQGLDPSAKYGYGTPLVSPPKRRRARAPENCTSLHRRDTSPEQSYCYSRAMKSGFTLAEAALSLAVAGLLLAIALPSLTALKQGAAVEQAAQNIVAAHRRARAAAILSGKPAILSVAARSLRITLAGAEQPHWAGSGPLDQGVSLTGGPHDITFSPIGISIGLANASLQLSQGNATRTVVVSRLGRARIVRSP